MKIPEELKFFSVPPAEIYMSNRNKFRGSQTKSLRKKIANPEYPLPNSVRRLEMIYQFGFSPDQPLWIRIIFEVCSRSNVYTQYRKQIKN